MNLTPAFLLALYTNFHSLNVDALSILSPPFCHVDYKFQSLSFPHSCYWHFLLWPTLSFLLPISSATGPFSPLHTHASHLFWFKMGRKEYLGMTTKSSGNSTVIILLIVVMHSHNVRFAKVLILFMLQLLYQMLWLVKSNREEVRPLGWILYDSFLISNLNYFINKYLTIVTEIIPRMSVEWFIVHWCFGTLSTVWYRWA